MDGQGTPQDFAIAKTWFLKATDKGSVESKYALGIFAYVGIGAPKNFSEAFKWFESAAKGWDRNAQFQLGKMYMNGEEVKVNLIEAHKWFDLAATAGHEEAHYFRAAVASKMSSEDKKRARTLAQEWFDANHQTPHKHPDLKPHQH